MTDIDNEGLCDQQKRFANEYLDDFNGTRAAIAAGYSEATARSKASQLLTKVNIKAYIQKRIHKRVELADIDAAYVLKELYLCWSANIADIIDSETGALNPVHDWPPIWQKMASGIKIKETYEGFGLYREKTGEIIDVIIAKKDAFLKLLGQCTSVGAFKEVVDINITHRDVSSKLSAARQRQQQSVESEN